MINLVLAPSDRVLTCCFRVVVLFLFSFRFLLLLVIQCLLFSFSFRVFFTFASLYIFLLIRADLVSSTTSPLCWHTESRRFWGNHHASPPVRLLVCHRHLFRLPRCMEYRYESSKSFPRPFDNQTSCPEVYLNPLSLLQEPMMSPTRGLRPWPLAPSTTLEPCPSPASWSSPAP